MNLTPLVNRLYSYQDASVELWLACLAATPLFKSQSEQLVCSSPGCSASVAGWLRNGCVEKPEEGPAG